MALLKKIKFGNVSNNIAKTVVTAKSGGVMSVAAPDGVTNGIDENADYQYELDVNVDGTTLEKSAAQAATYYTAEEAAAYNTENGLNEGDEGFKKEGDLKTPAVPAALKVGTVPAAQVSVDNTDAGITATTAQAAFKELKQEIDAVDGAAKTYTIIEKTGSLPTNVAHRYKLQQTVGTEVTEVGADIDIPKDSSLKEVYLGASTDTIDATTGDITKNTVTDPQSMNFAYQLSDGTYSLVKIDVSKFLTESEFGDGLEVIDGVVKAKLGNGLEFGSEASGNKSIKVKIDSTSEKDSQSTAVDFLTVGADGVKVQGVKAEIDRKIAALNVADAAVAGKYVSEVDETSGVISVERADVAAAPLNGYAKGEAEGALAATDTINQAFGKLENTIENNEQTTAAALNNLNSRIDAMDKAASAVAGQVVTTVAEADGVVSETKANVKDLELGGYAKDANATGAIDGTDTINTALSKLENAINEASSEHTVVAKDGNASHLTVTPSQAASGQTTYTIGETDIASETNLTAEVTRAKSAETAIDTAVGLTKDASSEGRTYTNTGNYIGKQATNTVKSDIAALDTQLKTVSDKVDGISYYVNGTELVLSGIPYVAPQP